MPTTTDKPAYFTCPCCCHALEKRERLIQCSHCDKIFPTLPNIEQTAFIEKPEEAIAMAYLAFHQAIQHWAKRAKQLAKQLSEIEDKKRFLPFLKALNDNQQLFLQHRDALSESVDIPTLLNLAQQQNNTVGYGYNYNYLTQDWSGQEKYEVRIQNLVTHLEAALSHCEGNNLLALGAGTGRAAVELQQGERKIWTLDNSLGQIAQFLTLRKEPIQYWDIETRNRDKDAEMIKRITASIPKRLKSAAEKITPVWADALATPFADSSMDIVLSIYFSDVVPLQKLLKEVSRVLKPGGYFIHYGPLHYHFPDITQHFSYKQFKDKIKDAGYNILWQDEYQPTPINSEDELIIRSDYIDKIIVAQKQAD